jgi:hypothetical protein
MCMRGVAQVTQLARSSRGRLALAWVPSSTKTFRKSLPSAFLASTNRPAEDAGEKAGKSGYSPARTSWKGWPPGAAAPRPRGAGGAKHDGDELVVGRQGADPQVAGEAGQFRYVTRRGSAIAPASRCSPPSR